MIRDICSYDIHDTQDHQRLHEFNNSKGKQPQDEQVSIPDTIKHLLENPPLFTPTLDTSLPPTVYRISHSSELVWVGMRSHWLFVKDASAKHALYAMQALWSDEVPITEAVLRRASEFLPGAGAVHVNLRKTVGGAFKLQMQSLSVGNVVEEPDR